MMYYEMMDMALLVGAGGLLLLAIKKIAGTRISTRAHVLIWAVLFLQIVLFPVREMLPESRVSLEGLLPAVKAEASAVAVSPVQTPKNDSGRVAGPLTFLWATGAVSLLALYACRHLSCACRLRRLPVCREERVTAILAECRENLGVRRDIGLRCGAESPMLAGFLRPVIYINDYDTTEELRCVLIHELYHYRHRDLWLNLLAVLTVCLFWYHPVVWLCFRTFRRDVEAYCDDASIAALGDKKTYALTLLKAASGGGRFIPATSSFLNDEKEVSRRIKRIAAYKGARPWASAAAAVMIACVAAFCLTGPAYGDGPEDISPVTAPPDRIAPIAEPEKMPPGEPQAQGIPEKRDSGLAAAEERDDAQAGAGVAGTAESGGQGELMMLDLAELERLAQLEGTPEESGQTPRSGDFQQNIPSETDRMQTPEQSEAGEDGQ